MFSLCTNAPDRSLRKTEMKLVLETVLEPTTGRGRG
eukprot:COSAG06_NODE_22214_length_730_cov_1.435816_1_plen_35_part_10